MAFHVYTNKHNLYNCYCNSLYHSWSQAISGQAPDRHLLGLRLIASEAGIELPGIFTDPAYSKSLHFNLSTSQVMNSIIIATKKVLYSIPITVRLLCTHTHTYHTHTHITPTHTSPSTHTHARWLWLTMTSSCALVPWFLMVMACVTTLRPTRPSCPYHPTWAAHTRTVLCSRRDYRRASGKWEMLWRQLLVH